MTIDNPVYPVDVRFSKESVRDQLTQKFTQQISDDETQMQTESSVLSQLTSVLQESHKILNITKKSDSNGFLSSLKFFSFKNTEPLENEEPDKIQNDQGYWLIQI